MGKLLRLSPECDGFFACSPGNGGSGQNYKAVIVVANNGHVDIYRRVDQDFYTEDNHNVVQTADPPNGNRRGGTKHVTEIVSEDENPGCTKINGIQYCW